MELRKELENLLKTDVNIEQLEDNVCVFTTKYMLFSYCKEYKKPLYKVKRISQPNTCFYF
ncbi:hypothetical protein OFR95_15175 [Brachyspira hyodysenteriae]|nr:hypothetical protein [Brachyspira hyodysenteriae]